MPNTNHSASWDFNPADAVHLSASFSFDSQDSQDSTPVAAALSAIQGRVGSATVTVTQSDPATIYGFRHDLKALRGKGSKGSTGR